MVKETLPMFHTIHLLQNRKQIAIIGCLSLLLILAWSVQTAYASNQDWSHLQQEATSTSTPPTVTPLFYPMYPGQAEAEAIFDHKYPRYADDPITSTLVAYNGRAYHCYDSDGNGKDECINDGPWRYYSGHDGIDFGVHYVPVLAAAGSNNVISAGWDNPNCHSCETGLHIKLEHTLSGGRKIYTTYGHLSALAVSIGVREIHHGDVIGISGNTGDSDGPHIHFAVYYDDEDPWHGRVDPYGWQPVPSAEVSTDPLAQYGHQQAASLWIIEPDVSLAPMSLPSGAGNALPFPTLPANDEIVDDNAHLLRLWNATTPEPPVSPNFESSLNCWGWSSEKSSAQNHYHLQQAHINSNPGPCWARWNLPSQYPDGRYSIYVKIPPRGTTHYTETALYEIYIAGVKHAEAIIHQEEISNWASNSDDATVRSGWIYLGEYEFDRGANGDLPNYIVLTNGTNAQDPDGVLVIADAVKFAP
jgi:murein DD-endopeptidase MepM/ murein hydrolase activator NlpD